MARVQGGVSNFDYHPRSNPAPSANEAISSLADARQGVISPKQCGMHQYIWQVFKQILSHLKNG